MGDPHGDPGGKAREAQEKGKGLRRGHGGLVALVGGGVLLVVLLGGGAH